MEHNEAMTAQTQTELVLSMAQQRGVLRARDLQAAGVHRVLLTRLTINGQLEKIGRGLYRLPEASRSEHEGMTIVANRSSQAVFCLLTALQFHGLTTQLSRQIWIAMPQDSHTPKIDYPPVRMAQFTGKAYSEGIESFKQDNIRLNVYCIAKTIADCFKHRNKIGLDIALEALKEAWQQKRISMDELWHYAKICRVSNVMRPYLDATV